MDENKKKPVQLWRILVPRNTILFPLYFLLFIWGACTPQPQAGQRCAQHADCMNNEVCVSGLCHQTCNYARDCPKFGDLCLDGYCQDALPDAGRPDPSFSDVYAQDRRSLDHHLVLDDAGSDAALQNDAGQSDVTAVDVLINDGAADISDLNTLADLAEIPDAAVYPDQTESFDRAQRPGLGESWRQVGRLPLPADLNSVIWTGDRFAAVGTSGAFLTSENGLTWDLHNTGADTDSFKDLVWTGDQFIVIAARSIWTSPNGQSWDKIVDDVGFSMVRIIQTDSLLLIVGRGGELLTSIDGLYWVARSTGLSDALLYDVAWSGSLFVVVGEDQIASSPDAITWTSRECPTAELKTVEWTGNQFVAMGWGSHLLTSADVISWSTHPNVNAVDISLFGEQLVAVDYGGKLLTSADGINWSGQISPTSVFLHRVAVGNGRAVAVGDNGTILSTDDATTWIESSTGPIGRLSDVVWNGQIFIASGNQFVVRSSNAEVWVEHEQSREFMNISSMVWTGSEFFSIGDTGMGSSDGVLWQKPDSWLSDFRASALVKTDTQLVAFPKMFMNTVYLSNDALEWTVQTTNSDLPSFLRVNDMQWTGSQIVAVGWDGLIMTSPDGQTWTPQNSGTSDNLNASTWTGLQIVAVGQNGTVLTSADGISWTVQNSGINSNITDIIWTGEQLVAVGGFGVISSVDALQWQPHHQGNPNGLNALVFADDKLVAVGSGGAIYVSP